MKLKTPESDDKSEIAGRVYQAVDLQMAIEGGVDMRGTEGGVFKELG